MNLNNIYLDAPSSWQYGFQDPATAVMEGIINFHHDLFFFAVVILVFVVRILVRAMALYNNKVNKTPKVIVHAPFLEIVWTIIPAIILILIAVPSFSLLYSIEEIVEPLLTVKVVGHQWYWSYELADPKLWIKDYGVQENADVDSILEAYPDVNYSFDSYMIADDDLQKGMLRLLEVDNRLYLPVEVNIRLLITSGDVLHSWAVPALGVKVDACPGRLNQTSVYIKRTGVFYGQCSEICGINHGFMPIVVEGVETMPGYTANHSIIQVFYPFFMAVYYPDK